MARLEFFVVSRSVSVDQASNSLSVFEILEVIQAGDFPGVIPDCVAVSLWRREPGDESKDFQLLLRVQRPSGSVAEVRSNFRMTSWRHRVIQRIQGLPIESEGQLRFEAVLTGEHAAEHVVDIVRGGPADAVDSPMRAH